MSDLFATRENKYFLRNFQDLEFLNKPAVTFEIEPFSHGGSKTWNLIPERLRT